MERSLGGPGVMNERDTALAYPLGAAGGSATVKGLLSSDVNHTGKVR
jgi:hypothetical protein